MDVDGTGYRNLFYQARNMSPIFPVHLHDMKTGEYILDKNGNKQYDNGMLYGRGQQNNRNTIWENELDTDKTTRKTMQGSLKTAFKLTNDLKFTINGDINTWTSNNNSYDNPIIGNGSGNNGRTNSTAYSRRSYTFQQQLYWQKEFGKHHVDALLGHENYDYKYTYLTTRKADQNIYGNPWASNFNEKVDISGYEVRDRMESYIGRGRYNYDEKIFIDASVRRDGSSRFSKKNRWGNFFSVGASAILSEYEFMDAVKDEIDFLKVRAGYGQTGNNRLNSEKEGYYPYMPLYNLSTNGAAGTLIKAQWEANDLTWETQSELSLAVEARLFRRLNISLEYYDRHNDKLLFNVILPASMGAVDVDSTSPKVGKNLGTMSNRGFEIGLSGDIIKTKDWTWNAALSLAFNKNKILKLPEENKESGIVTSIYKYTEGHGKYDYWMYQYAGVDMMSGRALYELNTEKYCIADRKQANETRDVVPANETVRINDVDYVYKTTYAKRDWSGSALPKGTGSLSTGVDYKGISLNALFTFGWGNKVMDYPYQSLMSIGGTNPAALHEDVLTSWDGIPYGMTESSANRLDKKATPILNSQYSSDINATSNRFLVNGSYLQFKNIRLAYRLPKEWLSPVGLNNASIGVTCENLWLFTARKGLNPQMSINGKVQNNATQMRTTVFNLKAEF
jgi:TonB-linked SusC/RagA family outer membrane protein